MRTSRPETGCCEEKGRVVDRQLSFDGREVTQIKSKYGELELDSLPQGLDRDQLKALTVGDELVTTVRWRLESKNHNEKSDRQGFGVKPFTRKLIFKILSVDFQVNEVDTQGFERKTRTQQQESTA